MNSRAPDEATKLAETKSVDAARALVLARQVLVTEASAITAVAARRQRRSSPPWS